MPAERLVHVIDDDDAVRDSLAFLLTASGLDVRAYESAVSFLDGISGSVEGCIVTDVRMPGMTGLELVAALSQRGVRAPVIVITGHADVPLAVQAMKAGVADFIEKPFEDDAIIGAVEAALTRPLAPGAQERAGNGAGDEIGRRLAALSERERQVLDALVEGKANKVIAYDLGISPRTVEVYRANVMSKMQAGSLSELVRMALLAGRGI